MTGHLPAYCAAPSEPLEQFMLSCRRGQFAGFEGGLSYALMRMARRRQIGNTCYNSSDMKLLWESSLPHASSPVNLNLGLP